MSAGGSLPKSYSTVGDQMLGALI